MSPNDPADPQYCEMQPTYVAVAFGIACASTRSVGQHQSDSTNSNPQENYNEKISHFGSGRSVVWIDAG